MFSPRNNIVSAIEFGTSKISVLVGAVTAPDGTVEVLGRGEAPSLNSVAKGEIHDMQKALEQLTRALDEADRFSDHQLCESSLVTVAVTGCGIRSQTGVGTAIIQNDDRRVTEQDCENANNNGKILNFAPDREIISSSESFFVLDGKRLRNPLQHRGLRLETHLHIVHGVSSRLNNFYSLIRDAGFENAVIEPVFSPIASDIGVLSELDREEGVLLIDLGAGCTEYVVQYDRGIHASGVLQLGMEHVANDLSVGLDLTISNCRKLLRSGDLTKAIDEHREYLEFRSSTGRIRQIPVASFETIIDLRLREIFDIVRHQLDEARAPRALSAGGVLTGGGALFPRARDIFRETFNMACRKAQPQDASGVITDFADPRYSTIWGALKIAGYYAAQRMAESGGDGLFNRFFNLTDNCLDSLRRGAGNFVKSLKF